MENSLSRRAPLAFCAVAFGIGIGSAWWFHLTPAVAWCLIGVAAALSFSLRPRRIFLPAGCIGLIGLLGALCAAIDAQPPADSIAPYLKEAPRPVVCEGILISDVDWIHPPDGPARRQGWFEITAIRQSSGMVPVRGRLHLRLPARGAALSYGDRIRMPGEIRGPRSTQKFDEAGWLWLHGACGRMNASDPEGIIHLDSPTNFWIRYRRWVASFRWNLKQRGRSLLGSQEAAYAEALLLGDGREIPRDLWETFKRSGTVHILVVSGQHVSLIGSMIFGVLSLVRIPRGLKYLLVAAALILYCTLTGANPPILRGTLMGVLFCFSRWGGYEAPALNSIGLAALVILAADPRSLADPSFQLSFASILGLVVLAPWFARRFGVMGAEKKMEVRRTILLALAASFGAWTAVSPFVAWYFRRVTPIALVANLIVVPWASILIAAGFVLYLVSMVNGWAVIPIAASFSWLSAGLTHLVTWLANLPGASWKW